MPLSHRAGRSLLPLGISALLALAILAACAAIAPAREQTEALAQSPSTTGEVLEADTPASLAAEVASSPDPPKAGAERAVPPPAIDSPVVPLKVKVKFDKPVLVVPGDTSIPIIYLHGRCGDPTAFRVWAAVGKTFGTIISFTGDVKCKNGERTEWGLHTASLDRRITRAIDSARAALGIEIDGSRRIVVGYSQGSLRAEALATEFPQRYPQAVLIGGPRGPRETSLKQSEAVLIVVGDHDRREHLRVAAEQIEQRGVRVRYLELKDARHGEYGPEALKTMQLGFDWLSGQGG